MTRSRCKRPIPPCAALLAVLLTGAGCGTGADGDDTTLDASPPDAAGAPDAVGLGGTYVTYSHIHLGSPLPAPLHAVATLMADSTDGADDPATWLLDAMVDGMAEGPERDALIAARPGLDHAVNEGILAGPEAAATFCVASCFAEGLHEFAFDGELIVTPSAGGTSWTASHDVGRMGFVCHGEYSPELVVVPVVEGIAIDVDDSRADVAEHTLVMPLGQQVQYALVAQATWGCGALSGDWSDLPSMYRASIDCASMGAVVYEQLGAGSVEQFQLACASAIDARVDEVTEAMLAIGEARLTIHGGARLLDTDADALVDTWDDGWWAGTIEIAGTAISLPLADQFFYAERW